MATTQVSKYRLIIRSGSSVGDQEDIISMYDVAGTHLGNLHFSDSEPVGKNTTYGYTSIVFPRNLYMNAVDMLRNEKPVYFEDNPSHGTLRTDVAENVGEDDI